MNKTPDSVREFIEKRIKEKKLSLNGLSIRIGRGNTYLYQYIKKKSPERLDEIDRKKLAVILDVPESELTDKPLSSLTLPSHMMTINTITESISSFFNSNNNSVETVSIDIINATACCGSGIDNIAENTIGQWIIPLEDFRSISLSSQPGNIKMLKVRGDSMFPTLKDGDWVLADISRNFIESDGLYLLRLSTGLAVKRIQGSSSPNTITIISDNPKYGSEKSLLSDTIILGRIIYTFTAEKVG